MIWGSRAVTPKHVVQGGARPQLHFAVFVCSQNAFCLQHFWFQLVSIVMSGKMKANQWLRI